MFWGMQRLLKIEINRRPPRLRVSAAKSKPTWKRSTFSESVCRKMTTLESYTLTYLAPWKGKCKTVANLVEHFILSHILWERRIPQGLKSAVKTEGFQLQTCVHVADLYFFLSAYLREACTKHAKLPHSWQTLRPVFWGCDGGNGIIFVNTHRGHDCQPGTILVTPAGRIGTAVAHYVQFLAAFTP